MSESKEYRVISPIEVGGVITKSGTVALPAEIAARFLAMPTPPIADPNTPPGENKDDEKQSGPTDGAGPGGTISQGLSQAQIVEAIAKLEPGNEKHWTKGNLPDANVLSDLLNARVSAAERDAAWAVYKESAASS